MNLSQTLGAAIIMACGSAALAGPVVDLAPGEITGGLSGITNTTMGELIGSVQSDVYQDFAIYANQDQGQGQQALYEGTLMTRVVRSNQTGNLHFNYRILNANSELAGMISRIEVDGFEGFQTRVEYRNELSSPGVQGPSDASRSGNGNILNFEFDELLDSSADSRYFFAMVDTDTFYENAANATIFLQNGESVTLSVAGATPSVPAPGALALLSAGGLMTMRRRR